MKEEKIFIKAYDKYAEKILRHIYFRVNDMDLAQDIIQETFFRTWRYISSSDTEIENLKNFLYRVANNLIIDYYRKKYKQPISIEDISEKEIIYEPDQEKQAEQRISKNAAEKYLAEVKEEYRQILIYRYVDDLSIKEISEITGKTPNNIGVIIHRALKALREKMKDV
jgi:RNA polymerase sigma-70 factor (ECF subfamily)